MPSAVDFFLRFLPTCWHGVDLYSGIIINRSNTGIMSNKIWALALVGAAAYLFKTKKGAELRGKISDATGKAVQTLKDKYDQSRTGAHDAIDKQLA
jgi:hypothetical protein